MGRIPVRIKERLLIGALLLAAGIVLKLNIGASGIRQREPKETQNSAKHVSIQDKAEPKTQAPFALRKEDIIVDPRLYYVKRRKRVTPLDFEFSLPGFPQCTRGSRPLLVVMVLTMPGHGEQRQVIRDTWGSGRWGVDELPWDVKVIFLLGKGNNSVMADIVKKEHAEFHDIVEAGFVESYYNLTIKVLMGFKWVGEFCHGADFVMKVDEDVFVNINRMIGILGTVDLTNTIFGPYFESAAVERTGKHGVGRHEFPLDMYPPHVKGNFYVMPTGLALRLVQVAQYMPYVCIEDAHITGILVRVIGGKHMGVTTSAYECHAQKPPEDCDFVKPFKLAAQGVSAARARGIWRAVLGKTPCKR